MVFGTVRGIGMLKRFFGLWIFGRFKLFGVIKMNRCINRFRKMVMVLKFKVSVEFFFVLNLFFKLFVFCVYGGEDRLMFF